MTEPALPKSIGRYEVVREIGRGAMGVVYEARDPELARPAAVKTMSLAASIPDDQRAQFEKRFFQEARAAAGLQHPGIVVVYEVGTDPATKVPFMALEYLRGRTLDSILKQDGRLEWKQALRLVGRLADALEHAHSQRVIHRDIKPANVMVLASGEPKIMDFGVAKLEASQLTTQGQVFGSPSYMAPEQALDARADARSDVFSLGAVLYELVTGKRAFGGGALSEILMRLAREEPPPPSGVQPGLPREIDAITARALVKDPAQRYASAKAFGEDIEDAHSGRPLRHASGLAAVPAPRAPAVPAAAAQTAVAGSGRQTLALPPGKRVSLAFLSGPRNGDIFVLAHPAALIGRQGGAAGAAIELNDSQVSRAHALVECHGARVIVRDLESTNGTFVDGQRIREHQLQDQDEFQVGATRLMLILADAE